VLFTGNWELATELNRELNLTTDRIAALLDPFLNGPLSAAQLQHISTYIDLLLRWNARVNLTAIRDPDEIVTRHFGESLFLARHLFPDSKGSGIQVLDIGSGAGFPGLPLKIWHSAISLTLVESNQKKAAFLREVIRALALTDVKVSAARAETMVDTHSKSDVVTFRAVERFDTVLPIAASLVAPSGRIVVMIGSAQLSALASIDLNLRWLPPIPVPQSQSRVLSISIPRLV
jgi:16S rRNA (guanine527-N7)-methyltransferase